MKHLLWAVVAISLSAGNAHALSQKKHAEISEQACLAAGFGASFCGRVGDEAYNTDADEFEDLAAHAQPDDGMSACTAASRSATRLRDLGAQARASLRAAAHGDRTHGGSVARAVGRALHTIEDNCAHHGMPNPQHAWFSLNDACHFTSTSPDLAPAAAACARQEATAALAALRRATDTLGIDRARLAADRARRRFPPVLEACAFLAEAPGWDGRDRRWNNAITVPAFRAQLASALTTDHAAAPPVCTIGQDLAPPTRTNVDTSGGVGTLCEAVVAFCDADKNDGATEPPWEHDEGATLEGGCRAAGDLGGGVALAIALACTISVRPRRRAATGRKPTVERVMNRSQLLAFALSIPTLLASACVEPDDGARLDDGREDSIMGKGMRLRPGNLVDAWTSDQPEPSSFNGETKIILTTNDVVVAESDIFGVTGTTADELATSPWSGQRIARLSVSPGGMPTADLVFIVLHGTGEVLRCKNARGEASAFASLAIDLQAKQLHADDQLTFDLAECGITGPEADGTFFFGAFPLAFSSDKPLVGIHPYRITAELL